MINCYTDGSHLEGHSGSAVVIVDLDEDTILSVAGEYLGEYSPIIAELYAIKLALMQTVSLRINPKHLRICSDCQSAVHLAKGISNSSIGVINSILNDIDRLVGKFHRVEFQWVRSHNGNHYNELADSIAYACAQG